MPRARLDEDVKPLSEFRANVSTLVQQVRRTKRPLVLTQRGHSAAVVLDVSEYEQLLEEVETLRDIHLAERQIAQGKGVSHARARQRVLAALRR
jgi:antitoxin YefM